MSPEEFEYGYVYSGHPMWTAVGPFRNKNTAQMRVTENKARILVRRPAGSSDEESWEEVPLMNPAPNPNGKCETCGGMWGEHIGKCPAR